MSTVNLSCGTVGVANGKSKTHRDAKIGVLKSEPKTKSVMT